MMFAARPVWFVFTALVLTCCSDSTADAQFLRIGPQGGVRLRLPMVSVDVGPGGATRVRAPFTAVDTPGHPYGSPYYGPAYPAPPASSAAAEHLSDQQLLQELAAAGDALARALAARQGGDVWVEYLRPHELAELARSGDTAALTRLLLGYDGVQANRQLTWLNGVSGFTATRTRLRQWLSRAAGQSTPAPNPTPAVRPRPAVPPTPAVPPQPGAEPTRAIPPQPAAEAEAAEAIPTPEPEATSIRIEA